MPQTSIKLKKRCNLFVFPSTNDVYNVTQHFLTSKKPWEASAWNIAKRIYQLRGKVNYSCSGIRYDNCSDSEIFQGAFRNFLRRLEDVERYWTNQFQDAFRTGVLQIPSHKCGRGTKAII